MDEDEKLVLWHKYWVVFAAACILEDMFFAPLHWLLFFPGKNPMLFESCQLKVSCSRGNEDGCIG